AVQFCPIGLTIVAILMILFGLAEIVTGFTHYFFGVTTTESNTATFLGATLGLCYFVGGLLILTKKRPAAIIAISLLVVDVIRRIAMVVMGLFPLSDFRQTVAIIVGTAIAAFFAVYISLRLKYFTE